MAHAQWRLEREWLKNCTCAFGCPCDFDANPTNGDCKGLLGMRITKGNYEQTDLSGLSFFVTVSFPGPLHEGNGQAQPIIETQAGTARWPAWCRRRRASLQADAGPTPAVTRRSSRA